MLIDGRAQPTGLRRRGSDATLLILFNSFHEPVPFAIPTTVGSEHWCLLLDTNNDELALEAKNFRSGDKYEVSPRSLQLFVLMPDPANQ
jgi:glycogen operon protein